MSLLVSRLRDADSEKQDAPLRDLSLRALVSRVPGALATGGC